MRKHVDRYEAAARVGDMAGVRRAVDGALRTGASVEDVHARVIAPAMVEIGRLWERGSLGVADEHLATAITVEEIARLYELAPAPALFREEVLLAAVEGEEHVLGLRMSADLLQGAGFRTRYLGADVAIASLEQELRAAPPAVVVLSVKRAELAETMRAGVQAVAANSRAAVVVAGDGVPADLREGGAAVYVSGVNGLVSAVEAIVRLP